MKLKTSLIASIVTIFCFSGLSFQASAHSTGGEIRHLPGCNKLAKKWKRKSCRRCLKRAKKHHFHPNARKGRRCMVSQVGIHRRVGCNRLRWVKRQWCKRCIKKGGVYRPSFPSGKRCVR